MQDFPLALNLMNAVFKKQTTLIWSQPMITAKQCNCFTRSIARFFDGVPSFLKGKPKRFTFFLVHYLLPKFTEIKLLFIY